MGCLSPSEKRLETRDNLRKLRRLFNGEKILDVDNKSRHVGNVIKDTYGDVSEGFSRTMFDELVFNSTYKPATEDYLNFKKSDYRRIANEIEKESKALSNKRINWFERLFFVKRGTMSKYTVTRWMNKQINGQINYERSKYSNYVNWNKNISNMLREEVVDRGATARDWWKQSGGLEKLERQLSAELANPKSEESFSKAQSIRGQIAEMMSTESGKVISEFIEYMEAEPAPNGRKYRIVDGKKELFSPRIEVAGKAGRDLLDDMGSVQINGLQYHKQVMRLATFNSRKLSDAQKSSRLGKKFLRFEDKIDKTIKDIEMGMKRGNYFPHIMIEGVQSIEKVMEKMDGEKTVESLRKNADTYMGEVSDIMARMRDGMGLTTQQAKARGLREYHQWVHNPLAAIRKYSLDALAFNKHNKLKTIYLRGIKRLPKDAESARVLKNYIDDVFTLASHGFKDRPSWINKTVRTLTGFEFLSKIGFGVATAARNMMSGVYYIQGLGNRAFFNYIKDWNANEELATRIIKLEREAGFRFEDVAQEYALEGLLPTQGTRVSEMDIKMDNKGNPYFAYKDGLGWHSFDSGLAWATNKGAIFQKYTENILRKHMFRSSFLTKWKELEIGGMKDKGKMQNMSKTYALDMVNKYAFEYAASQKAPVTGGTAGNLGAVGQVVAQFFHFPFSFLQLQSEILKKSKDAAIARQWDNPDLLIPMKFAGMYAFTHLLSGLTNLDFHRLMENDTVERIRDLKAVADGKEDVKGRGFVGPAVGDLFFLATLKEFIELPESEVTNLILGYNNAYALTDVQKQQRLLSTLNVELSKAVHRGYPALKTGTGWNWLMHEFGLYPRSWTREAREKFPLKYLGLEKPQKKKRGRRVRRRKEETELDRLYRAMGI